MSEEAECPQKNTVAIDQSSFWDSGNLNWDHHRVGWLISGVAAAITVFITAISVYRHARHYHVPAQQRQIIRILYLPAVFAVISWLSYRFFRHYTYYELVQIVYEAFALGAFTLLLIEYVAESSSSGKADGALERKEKTSLPLPFCCWRYRPTKGYFLHTVKWSVMQYVVIRPLISIAGIVCEAFEVLCEESYSPKFAYVYLMATDFASISVALYGLWLFYSLCKEELEDKRPFAKFLLIKILVALTFYQQFIFVLLTDRGIITETEYWTASNISDGLNALAVTIEMVIISACMMWAFPSSEYTSKPGQEGTTSIGRALLDSINFGDFFFEIWQAFRFYWNSALNKPTAPPTKRPNGRSDFDTAFRLSKFSTSGQPTSGDPWYSGSARPSMGEPMSATAPLVPPGDRYPRQQPSDPQLRNTYQQPPLHLQPRQDSRTTYPPEPQAQRRPPEGVVFGQAL